MHKKNSDNTFSSLQLAKSELEENLGIHIDNKPNFKGHVQCTTVRKGKPHHLSYQTYF